MEYILHPVIFRRVRHSRMLLAGPPHGFGRIRPSAEIQAEFGLDPRLKHSGVTILGKSHLFTSAAIFEGGHEEDDKKIFTRRRGGHRVGYCKIKISAYSVPLR
jgi:hypothetical protein